MKRTLATISGSIFETFTGDNHKIDRNQSHIQMKAQSGRIRISQHLNCSSDPETGPAEVGEEDSGGWQQWQQPGASLLRHLPSITDPQITTNPPLSLVPIIRP